MVGKRFGKDFHNTLFGDFSSPYAYRGELFFFNHSYACFDEISYHGFYVSADVTDFGVFGRFHLYERRADEFGESSRDFGFAYARRTFHYNVLRRDFGALFFGEFASSVTVTKRDCHRPFRVVLTDDVFIEFFYGRSRS